MLVGNGEGNDGEANRAITDSESPSLLGTITPIPQSFWELVMEPFDGTQDPRTHLQAFQT
ncbi:hypothetical protein CR513_44323, partial [Mucuna pruriens]